MSKRKPVHRTLSDEEMQVAVEYGLSHLPDEQIKALVAFKESQDREYERFARLPIVRKGIAFSQGKPKGAVGPLRKLVRKMLVSKANRTLTARELWEACKALPVRGRSDIEFGAADAWIPEQGNVSFRRFANIVSEERKSLK